MNHSSGNVQVMELVTLLRNFSRKLEQIENTLEPVAQDGTKQAQ